MKCAWWLVLSVLVLSAPSLMAQTASTGAISGTIKDSSGAVIPNVTVTAISADSGQSRTVVTASDGSFELTLLPLGLYNVKFDAVGFNSAEVGSVEVKVTETSVLNRVLQVGTQTQQIVIEGEAVEAVQTSNATLGDVVGSTQATSLPLTTRNYTNLLGLSSGANASVFNASSLGKGSTDISVNGASNLQNNVQMDGVSIVTTSTQGTLTENGNNPGMGYVSPDAMQEFKIQTSLFDAGYGRSPGASVNLVTKSGTNQFHGDVFEFFRNTALNANDFFRNSSPPVNGQPNNSRQILNQNQFGGVFGGPVKKDKLFFFGSYQGTRQINGASSQGYSVPSLLPIFPGGDRSNTAALQASLGATFCPQGTDGGISGVAKTQGTAVQVACNGSNINPVAIALLQAKNPDGSYYIPSSSGTVTSTPCSLAASATCTSAVQNTTFTVPAHFTENQVLGNMDYVINQKNTLAVRYFWTTDPTQNSFACGLAGGLPGICYPDTALANTLGNIYGVMKLTTIVSNNLVNEARVSVQRATIVGSVVSPFTASQFGIQPISNTIPYLPQLTVTGVFSIGDVANYPVQKFTSQWEAADQISWTHGKHTVRVGVELERDRYDWHLIGGTGTGQINFNNFQDFLLGLAGCPPSSTSATCSPTNPGNTNGSSVSNISNTGGLGAVMPPGGLVHGYRTPYGDAFVQDDFKVDQHLTLNLGLRWDYVALAYDSGGFESNIWPSLISTVPIPGSTPATGTLAGWVVPSNWNFGANAPPPVGGIFQNSNNTFASNGTPLTTFSPRLGFAWSPFATNRFVLRGGGGYFYDRTGNANYNPGYEQNEPYSASAYASGAANYFSTFQNPFPAVTLGWTPRWVNFGAAGTNAGATSSNIAESLDEQIYRVPVTYQWNLNTQYEFVHNWTLELGYVGSRSLHQPGVRPINEAQLVGNPFGTNTAVAPGIAAGLVTTNTVANAFLRVPYLGFSPSSLTMSQADWDAKFNSVQATVRRQFSHGLQLQAAYTWSRAFTTNQTVSNSSSNDPNVEQYGLNPLYHPQRLAVSYLWNLPLGSHQGFMDKVANGWSVSGVTILQDGTPLTVTDTRGGTIFGFGPGTPVISRAEYCPGMGAANAASSGGVEQRLGGAHSATGWFNTAAFYGLGTNGGCAAAGATGTPTIGNGTGYGDSSLGILLGPGQFNWDMSLTKTTKVGGIREDSTLVFRTEFFNTFNHAQFNNPATVDVSKATFGQITSTSVNPRLIQFALKYVF
ncbi:MAG: carboxypeptidase-like regulatory domain-containing protein [Candidatus Acidiferrales bacterium]